MAPRGQGAGAKGGTAFIQNILIIANAGDSRKKTAGARPRPPLSRSPARRRGGAAMPRGSARRGGGPPQRPASGAGVPAGGRAQGRPRPHGDPPPSSGGEPWGRVAPARQTLSRGGRCASQRRGARGMGGPAPSAHPAPPPRRAWAMVTAVSRRAWAMVTADSRRSRGGRGQW